MITLERSTCPTPEALAAFSLGKCPVELIESIAAHIETCPSCESTLTKLEDSSDRLICEIRQPTIDGPIPEEESERAVAIVEAVRMEFAGKSPAPAAHGHDHSTISAPPRTLGQYEILEVLGQGGMGTVYKARHTKLNKLVALKVLAPERTNRPEAIARFYREMTAVGGLDHPNIVQATDAGEADGTQFLVMELVDGIDLSRLLSGFGPLGIPEACECARQAALGLEHAREHKMVHRDIKPSNLILTRDGLVKLLDLGLALLRDEHPRDRELTAPSQVVGTLDYMAPEQLDDTHSVDIRADIYSLGCTLYKLLTGSAPFSGPEFDAPLKKAAAHADLPVPPLEHRRASVPSELVTVVNRMLAKKPSDRYATPAELAQALGPFTTGCNLIDLVSAARNAAHAETRRGPEVARIGVQRPTPTTWKGYLPWLFAALVAASMGLAIAWHHFHFAADSQSPAGVRKTGEAARFVGHTATIRVIAFRPDGVQIVTASDDKTVRLWDSESTRQVRAFQSNGPVHCLALSADGDHLACGGLERRIRLWNLETGAEVKRFGDHEQGVQGLAFSADGRHIVTADGRGTVRIWDYETSTVIRQFNGGTPLWFVALTPDSRYLIGSAGGKLVRLWHVEDGQLLQAFAGHTDAVRAVAVSSDGQLAASGSDDRTIRVWDTANGLQTRCFTDLAAPVLALAISSDKRLLLSGGSDNLVRLWELESGREIARFDGHTGAPRCVAFSNDGDRSLSGGDDKTVLVRNLPRVVPDLTERTSP